MIIAEDNDKLRHLYSEMFQAAGFKVMHASDGEKAISLLHKIVNPQLIILDVMMPRMDGIETCARIRKMQGLRPCPILFLTALDSPDTILECLNAGGDDYLVKSAPMAEIVERVQYWARKGSSDDGTERRKKAIKELKSLSAEDASLNTAKAADEIAGENATLDLIATFIKATNEAFSEKDETFYRFGYLVGLLNSYVKHDPARDGRFSRLLRNLVYRTDFVDRKEIDALLDNYERIVNQSQFKEGWKHGQNVAADIGVPQTAQQQAALNSRAASS
ncbi:response regulator transcription factor [Pelagibius litoralis]|uniref:Response regulator transcription factor n=1 Tax=Pelagibius litoralis TaxID=374515 RepID=A0A967F3M4_9PROT|nr:response regulator transcription factor [Pelagibius litoralis]